MGQKKIPEILDKYHFKISKLTNEQLELAKILHETNKTGIADYLNTLQKIPHQERTDSTYTRFLNLLTNESNSINDSWFSVVCDLIEKIVELEAIDQNKELQRYYKIKNASE